MSERRQIGRVALTAVLALVTLSTDVLLSQAPAAGNRRIVMLDGREVVEGEVIVRYRARSGRVERERAEYQADSDGSETIGRLGTRRMSSRMMTTRQMLATLRANPDVEFAEPNYVIRANAAPNDPSMGSLWGLLNTGQHVDGRDGVIGADINATAAWDLTTGSRSTIVAILDTGIDFSHPDLAANVFTAPRQFTVSIGDITVTCGAGTHGFNAFSNGCNPFDDSGHGTHVAGIIGAVGNNGIGVTGVNWTANMMALKVLDANGTGTTAEAIRAIEFAIKAKAALGADGNVRILNASWGGANYSQALADEIQAANSADMLFVAAAGSDGRDTDVTPHYPASLGYNNIISVAGVDNTGELESFSNYGATSVDLAAPGGSTLSTLPNNDYGYLSGTSMAAPFVSGAAALVLSNCTLTTAELKNALLNTVDPVASLNGKTVSGGSVNAYSAVRTCAPPRLRTNGSSGDVTVAAGSSITVEVLDGPAYPGDFVMLVPAGSAPEYWSGNYQYLNGTTTRPGTGVANATLTFTAPAPGSYEFRFFENDRWRLLAKSGIVTVSTAPPTLTSLTPSTIVGGSSAVTITLTGSSFTSSSQARINGVARTTTFVSATQLTTVISATERATPGTLAVTVQNTGGATSSSLNLVIGPRPVVTVNGSSSATTVAPGSTVSVAISGGPANRGDFVMMVPAGSSATYWSGNYKYLNNTTTAPASGVSSATVTFTAPSSNGTFEFRFFENDTWALLNKSAAMSVSAPQPTLTVNGSNSTVNVMGSSNITVAVANGPANRGDFVMLVPVGSAETYWSGNYQYLNGTTTAPASGMSSATLTFAAPASGGTFEFRFFANDTWTRLATSAPVNVTAWTPPAPTVKINGSTGSVSVAPGANFTVGIENGPANRGDFVMLVPYGSAETYWSGIYQYLNGSTTAPSSGVSSATLTFTAPTAGGQYEVRFFKNDTWTRLATSGRITVSVPTPQVLVNGNAGAVTVAGGDTVVVDVSNGPAMRGDFVMMVPYGSSSTYWSGNYQYLNGTTTAPSAGVSSATLSFATPAGGGTFEFRFFKNDTWTLLASSGAVNVLAASSAPRLSVNGTLGAVSATTGTTLTVKVTNGPANRGDFVMLVPSGAAATYWSGNYQYLNGSTTAPASGLSSATLSFTAPAAGNYEFRFFRNDTWTLLATSGTVTTTP